MTASKYRNRKTTLGDHTFDSMKEAHRYQELWLLQKAGKIADLELQPRFKCVVDGQNICTYVADFRYVENGKTVVEDAKGMLTPIYRLKKKLVKALHGIEILET